MGVLKKQSASFLRLLFDFNLIRTSSQVASYEFKNGMDSPIKSSIDSPYHRAIRYVASQSAQKMRQSDNE